MLIVSPRLLVGLGLGLVMAVMNNVRCVINMLGLELAGVVN